MSQYPLPLVLLVNTARLAVAIFALMLAISAADAQSTRIAIGTGGVTGVYYPAGGAICRLVNENRRVHGLRCGVESTDGSVYNVNALREGDLEFAIIQSDVQADAVSGIGAFAGGQRFSALRSVFALHAEPMHLLARSDAGIGSLADLEGKRVNIGNPGSGTRVLAERLLHAAGLETSAFSETAELRSADQAEALCGGRIDASIWAAGTPNGSTEEATRSCAVKILPLAGRWVDALLAENAAYARVEIPGGIYEGNPSNIATYGPRATLVTSAATPVGTVYTLVKAVFDDLDGFKELHPALARLEAETMIAVGLVAPLHPGAERYFTERGWM